MLKSYCLHRNYGSLYVHFKCVRLICTMGGNIWALEMFRIHAELFLIVWGLCAGPCANTLVWGSHMWVLNVRLMWLTHVGKECWAENRITAL